jgi:arsenate reductase
MEKARVLFLCTGNSARSQMAEGFLRHLAGDRFEVFSAGIHPKGLNPLAACAMREIGIDISGQRSKDVSEYLGQDFSWVITVCDRAKESCPVFSSSAKRLHWSLNDPAEAEGTEEDRLAVFRRVRDEIASHIRDFMARPA